MTDTPKQPATEAGPCMCQAHQDARRLLSIEPSDLPQRVVVGANGAYWRDHGDHYSMPPVSEDNDPVEVVAVYEQAAGLLALREAAKALDHAYGAASIGILQELTPERINAWHALQDAVESTPAAAEIEARIEKRGYLRGFVAGTNEAESITDAIWQSNMRSDAVKAWLASPEAEQRLAAALVKAEPFSQHGQHCPVWTQRLVPDGGDCDCAIRDRMARRAASAIRYLRATTDLDDIDDIAGQIIEGTIGREQPATEDPGMYGEELDGYNMTPHEQPATEEAGE